MRFIIRTGVVLGLLAAACKDEPLAPVDFTDPTAISANLGAADSAFDSNVYRSFTSTTSNLDPAAPSAALQPAARLLGGTLPLLNRGAKSQYLMTEARAERLRVLQPQMSLAATAGRIIPDSLYGKVFEYDTAANSYKWLGATTTNLNGVRFILYQVDEFGVVIEPVVPVGRLDIVDQSTLSTLRLHVLVQGQGGTPTYLDYTASVTATATSVRAVAEGFLSNGLGGGDNKTLTFDETFNVNQTSASVTATFTLNNPPLTFSVSESVSFSGEALVVSATFRIVQPGETVSFRGRVTLYSLDSVVVHAAVYVNGHPVARVDGDADTAEWVDAGGEPLTADDLTALEGLDASAARFLEVVEAMFAPVGTFFGA